MNALMDIGTVGIGGTILIGILAGWIAEKMTGSNHGLLRNLIVGLAGSAIGFFISNAMGLQLGEIFQGWFVGNLIVSTIGATLLLTVLKLFRSSKRA